MLTGGLIKAVLMTVLIVLAVIPLAVCMEVADAGCAHACCTGADRSRPLQRALRRARALVKAATTTALASLTGTVGLITSLAAHLTPAPNLTQAVPLRI